MLYTSQQHRLLSLACEHANVILGLNSLTVYVGIASGAALGGVVLRVTSVILLGWVGTGCILVAVLVLFASIQHVHAHQGASSNQKKRRDS